MNKKLLTIIIPILVIGLFITGCNVKDSDGSEYRTITFDPNISVSKTVADMRPYDIEEMIAESSVIAYGTVVGDIKSYVDENSNIHSVFDFEISSVEKGDLNIGDIVSVKTQGGIVTYAEYLEADRWILEEMHSPEYIDEQKLEYADQYIESVFEDVPNVKTGEKLFLFLMEPYKNEIYDYDYYVSKNSYYGKFAYDKKSDEYYREKMDDFTDLKNNNSIKVKKVSKIKQKDFKEKIKKTKDTSRKTLEEVRDYFNYEGKTVPRTE